MEQNVEQSSRRESSERSLDRHLEKDKRLNHHNDEHHHPDDDVRELLAQKEFGFADRRGLKIGDRAGFLLAHDTDRRHDRRDQNQHYHDNARHHGEDALESLIVAEAIFDIEVAEVDVGDGVRAKTLGCEVLHIVQHRARNVSLCRLAPERHGTVDPEADLWRMQVCNIAAEARRNLNHESQFAAPHPALEFLWRPDRRLFGKIMRAREAFEQPAAFRRAVLVEGRIFQILDVEGDAIAHREHQNDRTDEGECKPDGISQQLHRLASGIGP